MLKPSAIRFATPRMITTVADRSAPAPPATTAKVVTALSIPTLDEIAQMALLWRSGKSLPYRSRLCNSTRLPLDTNSLTHEELLDLYHPQHKARHCQASDPLTGVKRLSTERIVERRKVDGRDLQCERETKGSP